MFWNRSLREAIAPFDVLTRKLEIEESYSMIYLTKKDPGSLELLVQSRFESDKAINNLKEQITKLDSEDFSTIGVYKQRILGFLANLNQMRAKIDSRSVSAIEVINYFKLVANEVFATIDSLNTFYDPHIYFFNRHFAYIYIMKSQHYFNQVSNLVLLSYEKKLTIAELDTLIEYYTLERDSYASFQIFSSDMQKEIYNEYLTGAIANEVSSFVELIIHNQTNNNKTDVQYWIQISSKKYELLTQVTSKIRAYLEKESRAFIQKDIFLLVFVSVLSLLIIIVILWFGWKILNDITYVVRRLNENSNNFKSRDLSTIQIFDERSDELGELEGSFFEISQSYQNVLFTLKSEIAAISGISSNVVNKLSELANGQQETESAVVETNTTIEELRHTSSVATERSGEVKEMATLVLEFLEASKQAIDTTVSNLNQIQEKIGIVSDSTTKLNEHCQAIGLIIDSVHDIAEQSHVLSVNASIEAAKAGEHGKGFAVVAQEVQNLAEQSKEATGKVHGILTDIQNAMNATVLAAEQGSKAVEDGVKQSSSTTGSINELSTKVDLVITASNEISSTSDQQLNAVNQVYEAIGNIKKASELQGDQVKGIEENITNLHQVSETLSGIIQSYKLPEEPDAEKPKE
ncbi:MAG: methyl-accepting chemotaxis protein [Simkaniaceae bacterium]|nr:methyl-accepting chemotaxis protein [Simkaniaceae bacterium]